MGRSKQSAPKRRRIETLSNDENSQKTIEEKKEQQRAIEILRTAPSSIVEKAAADAIRKSLPFWEDLSPDHYQPNNLTKKKSVIDFPGLGIHNQILSSDFQTFQKLHDIIKQKTSHVQHTSWSGSLSDPRRRAFGFLPGTLGYNDQVRNHYLDISTPGVKMDDNTNDVSIHKTTTNENERRRNNLASVLLKEEDIPNGFYEAFERLLKYFQNCIRFQNTISVPINKDQFTIENCENNSTDIDLSQYLTISNLVAAQPNLHCGRHLLPSHVDHPTKDGFGIIILTIAIRGGASILLETFDQKKKGKLRLDEGQAYMLSDFVRNACTHGVLADGSGIDETLVTEKSISLKENTNDKKDQDQSFRESLNFRFGLHGWKPNDPKPSEVLKYWGPKF